MTSEKDRRSKPDPSARSMSLEGMEALELYLAQIEHNLAALGEQMALLQTARTEREELLRKTVACLAERDELLREIEFNHTIVQWINLKSGIGLRNSGVAIPLRTIAAR